MKLAPTARDVFFLCAGAFLSSFASLRLAHTAIHEPPAQLLGPPTPCGGTENRRPVTSPERRLAVDPSSRVNASKTQIAPPLPAPTLQPTPQPTPQPTLQPPPPPPQVLHAARSEASAVASVPPPPWLLIGINTVARPHGEEYLLTVLAELYKQMPSDGVAG